MPAFTTVFIWLTCLVLCWESVAKADESFLEVLLGGDTNRAKAMLVDDPALLEKEIDLPGWRKPMRPLLYVASRKNHAMMTVLIDAGADVNAANRDWSPIKLAAFNNDLAGLRLLLNAGARNQITSDDAQNGFSYRGTSALAVAAREGHQEIIDELLGRGISVNDGDVLKQAIVGGKWKLVKFLLHRGADPKRDNVLVQAVHIAPVEIVEMLLEYGADAKDQWFHHALAAASNDIQKVKLLVAAGADVNDGSIFNDERPLHQAAFWGNLEVVEFLLSKNADVKVEKKDGQSPLDLAIRQGHLKVVKRLLDAGAERTLHTEVALGDVDAVKLALASGADVNLAILGDYAPQLIHTAIKFERDKVLELLLEKGANVDAEIADVSALHQAVTQRSVVLTKLLLEHGANSNVAYAPGRYGSGRMTPLHILAGGLLIYEANAAKLKTDPKTQQAEIEIAKMLLKSGAQTNLKSESDQTALQLAERYKKHLIPLLGGKLAVGETE